MDADSIKRQLALFSDPATPIEMMQTVKHSIISLVKDGREISCQIENETMKVTERRSGREFFNLASFLASDLVADIRQFSSTQRRVLSMRVPERWIETSAHILKDGDLPQSVDFKSIQNIIMGRPLDHVSIILIDGPAGVGKTSFIERLTHERSMDPSLAPVLHVTSKGRRLSNLPDAIAKTGSDLMARFRAEQVPVLAQHGCLIVAIDGFDELVQPDGYGNAWAALRDFIRTMEFGGPLILAGRDSFFDQQEVVKRLRSFGLKIEITLVRVREIEFKAAKEWLSYKGWQHSELSSDEFIEFFKSPYTRRPFFLTQIAEVGGFSSLNLTSVSPQSVLIEKIVTREANILKPALPDAELGEIVEALYNLCQEVAFDMAEREIDTVSLDFLEVASEVMFEKIAGAEDARSIAQKAGSIALIEPTNNGTDRRFPHSEVQNYFLSRGVYNNLKNGSIATIIRTKSISSDLLEAFSDLTKTIPKDECTSLLSKILNRNSYERLTPLTKGNLAALAISMLGSLDEFAYDIEITDATIAELRVFGVLLACKFKGVHIASMDARGADVSALSFEECEIGKLLVDENTILSASLPSVPLLQVAEDGIVNDIRQPRDIAERVRGLLNLDKDAEFMRKIDQELPRFFLRVCYRFLRQHQIRAHDDDIGYALIKDKNWEKIEKILLDAGFLEISAVGGKSGQKNNFYRLKHPSDLLDLDNGSDSAVEVRRLVAQLA